MESSESRQKRRGFALLACGYSYGIWRKRRRSQKVQCRKEAEAFQQAWLFDAALDRVKDDSSPRAQTVKAAALVGLERFSEARQILDEIHWKDLLVAAETGIDRLEFLERCEVLERQSGAMDSKDSKDSERFAFKDIFSPMLRAREARESGRNPGNPSAATLLPPVAWSEADIVWKSIVN